jgi:hypothetical protein
MTTRPGNHQRNKRRVVPADPPPPRRFFGWGLVLPIAGVAALLTFWLILSPVRSPESLPIATAGAQAPTPTPTEQGAGDTVSLLPGVAADAAQSVANSASASAGSHLPQVTGVDVQPQSFYRGVDLTASAEVSDKDGDLAGVSYRWFVNDEHIVVFDQAHLPGDQFYRGDRLALEVVAYDAEGDGPVFRTADVVVSNGPPRIVSRPPEVSSTERYEYPVQALDPDNDTITYSLEQAPAGMSIDPVSGLLSWPIRPENVGVYSFRVVASDPGGMKSSQEYSMDFSMKAKQQGGQ